MAKAKMQATEGGFRLDMGEYNEFLKKLAKATGASWGDVVEHETLKVLQTASAKTKRSTAAKAGGKFNPTSRNFKG